MKYEVRRGLAMVGLASVLAGCSKPAPPPPPPAAVAAQKPVPPTPVAAAEVKTPAIAEGDKPAAAPAPAAPQKEPTGVLKDYLAAAPGSNIRGQIIDDLGNTPTPQSLALLTDIFRAETALDNQLRVLENIAESDWELPDTAVLPLLQLALAPDRNGELRMMAVGILRKLDSPRTRALLLELCGDPDPSMRQRATEILDDKK